MKFTIFNILTIIAGIFLAVGVLSTVAIASGANYWAFVIMLGAFMMSNWFTAVAINSHLISLTYIQMRLKPADQELTKKIADGLKSKARMGRWFYITALCLCLACIRIYVPKQMDLAFDFSIATIAWSHLMYEVLTSKRVRQQVPGIITDRIDRWYINMSTKSVEEKLNA